ncbi:hypothetical protein OC834_003502 [Tilletia horrida]|nr:hypothetical protein OC834_003502 [Tilletia horrida]
MAAALPPSQRSQAAPQQPVTFAHSPIVLPAEPASLQVKVLAALAHTVVFHRALGNTRPRTITLLENTFPAVHDQLVDDLIEAALTAARGELSKGGGVQLVISIYASSALAPSQLSSEESRPTSAGGSSPSGTARLKNLPISWISQAVSLANQAYTHGYTFSGYGPSAGDAVSAGGDVATAKSSRPGQEAQVPFEQWRIGVRVVSFKTEHDATIDFVDRFKSHLPSVADSSLLPFPIRISAVPLA